VAFLKEKSLICEKRPIYNEENLEAGKEKEGGKLFMVNTADFAGH
jgi:hypothetical protein